MAFVQRVTKMSPGYVTQFAIQTRLAWVRHASITIVLLGQLKKQLGSVQIIAGTITRGMKQRATKIVTPVIIDLLSDFVSRVVAT